MSIGLSDKTSKSWSSGMKGAKHEFYRAAAALGQVGPEIEGWSQYAIELQLYARTQGVHGRGGEGGKLRLGAYCDSRGQDIPYILKGPCRVSSCPAIGTESVYQSHLLDVQCHPSRCAVLLQRGSKFQWGPWYLVWVESTKGWIGTTENHGFAFVFPHRLVKSVHAAPKALLLPWIGGGHDLQSRDFVSE